MTRPEDTVRECPGCTYHTIHVWGCRQCHHILVARYGELVAERDRLLEQATQDRATILLREAERDRFADTLDQIANGHLHTIPMAECIASAALAARGAA